MKGKLQKGITLIALIITIVVLLIIAVVAIGVAQDSNIVGYAQNAAGKYEEGKGLENDAIAGYENLLNKYANGGNNTGSSSGGTNTPNQPINYLGRYIKYDSNGDGSVEDETILWRVLRDDSDKVELITADTMGLVDLRATSFEDARTKYNRAVELMVDEGERLTGIDGVRNVGGPAVDTADIIVFEDLTIFAPKEGGSFAEYEGDNGFKVADNNYEEDWNQMHTAGVVKADNLQEYWLASRYVKEGSLWMYFSIRDSAKVGNYNSDIGLCSICYDTRANYDSYGIYSYGVRPVLTLSGGILSGKTGGETPGQAIELYQN